MPDILQGDIKNLFKNPIEVKTLNDIIQKLITWQDIAKSEGTPEDNANKRQIFAQNDAPTSDYKEEDLWFDTDDDNNLYRANSSLQWISLRDGSIFSGNWSDIVDDGGKPDDAESSCLSLCGSGRTVR